MAVHGSTILPPLEAWTFDDVQDRLVEAVQFQWRCERGGWPFASDGPWHLIVKDWWDWAAHEEKPIPRIPLSREQHERMVEATGWLRHAPDDDRRLVVMGVTALAKGKKVVPFRALLRPLGLRLGADGLRKRYNKAITAICVVLNAAEIRA